MGGAFAIFSYEHLGSFDYTPYTAAMREAAGPVASDDQRPTLVVQSVQRTGRGVVLSGTATDDTAIRAVSWRAGTAGGAETAAERLERLAA